MNDEDLYNRSISASPYIGRDKSLGLEDEGYDAKRTHEWMPILCEVDRLKGKKTNEDMIKTFYSSMKQDDGVVKYAISGQELGSFSNKRAIHIKKTYEAAIDTFRVTFENDTLMNQFIRRAKSELGGQIDSGGGQHHFDLVSNPLLSLEAMVQGNINDASSSDQIIRYFD